MTETAKKKILIVDNNPVILKLMSELLMRNGHDVVCVEDVFGCLDTLVDITPDIIFLDLIMPQIGGDDLCKIIRNIDYLQNCYIAIVSAVALEQDVDFAQIGANACIAKGPFKEMSRHILQAVIDSEAPRKNNVIPDIKGAEDLHSRQVTRELLQQNHHLKVIFESMSQGIIETSQNRIVYINPKAAEIVGESREKILGTAISTTIPLPLLTAIQESPKYSAPIQLAGRQVIVEQFPIKSNNQNTIIMLSDITERKKMEAVIEATNLTEKLGYVFSGIRHEIGNPVNSIKMALSVLQKNLSEYDHDTINEFLDRSLQEITRIEYLLKALKNYSLFESPVMHELSIANFMTDFIALVRNDFENHHIRIQTIIPDGNLMIWADSRALHHIMLNLMTNAADALDGCESPQIVVSVTKTGDWVDIKVDDNGKGMSKTDQMDLFKPFFTSKTSGTGLGLVIVKKMLIAMNSRIRIDSYQGMGTTVTVTLPGSENA